MKKITESASKKPIQDLREWLSRVEALGDLVRVKESVSCEEEMSAIGYLVAKQKPSPAILFDNIKGYENSPYKAQSLWNILGPSHSAHCAHDGRAARHADGGTDSPREGQTQKPHDAAGSANAADAGFLSEHAHRRQNRFDPIADSAATGPWTAAVTPAPPMR